jgi:hypothetical protein
MMLCWCSQRCEGQKYQRVKPVSQRLFFLSVFFFSFFSRTSARISPPTPSFPQSGVNTLFPLFANDTITYTVSDGGASAPPVYLGAPAALSATLVLTIAVQVRVRVVSNGYFEGTIHRLMCI